MHLVRAKWKSSTQISGCWTKCCCCNVTANLTHALTEKKKNFVLDKEFYPQNENIHPHVVNVSIELIKNFIVFLLLDRIRSIYLSSFINIT